jgi:hypothetical protein
MKPDKFVQGYMCALATIVKVYGTDTAVEDAFGCCPRTEEQMKEQGVDESDIEALRPVIRAHQRKKALLNPPAGNK